MDDAVFRALGDPTRRALLDALFDHDGQSLSTLAARFDISRFGVSKHLRVLEDAHLVLSRRRGREKVHFLNAVPIRLVHDRWVGKYAEPVAAGLSDLKRHLEQEPTMEKIFEIYIRTTPERLWEAITDPDQHAKWQFGNQALSDWAPGSRVEYRNPHAPGMLLGEGDVVESDPPRRLVQLVRYLWDDDVRAAGTTRVTWQIERIEDTCCLLVTHDQLPEDADGRLYGGWPMMLSGLKTWLESGTVLTTPGSLMYR